MMRLRRRVGIGLLLAVLLGALGCGSWAWSVGYRAYIVHTGSMVPSLNLGDAVIDRPSSTNYHPGEIITFRHSATTTDLVTHRVVDVTGGLIHTKGDANRTADAWSIHPDQVRGSVMVRVPYLGYVLEFLRQPTGAGAVAMIALATILLWGLFLPAEQEAAGAHTDSQLPDRARRRYGRHHAAATS